MEPRDAQCARLSVQQVPGRGQGPAPQSDVRRNTKQSRGTKSGFCEWARSYRYEKTAAPLDVDRTLAYHSFPKEHWTDRRNTNIIAPPFAYVRLRKAASKRYKRAARAPPIIWKQRPVGEQVFRQLNGPHLLPNVILGLHCEDGEHTGHPAVQQPIANNLAARYLT